MSFQLSVALIVSVASLTAQVERTFQFRNATAVQQVQEAATVIRSVGQIRDVTVNGSELIVNGSKAQLDLAAWLFPQLDAVLETPLPHKASGDFLFGGDQQDVVRVLRAAHAGSVQTFQAMATTIRSVTEIRQVFTDNRTSSIVMRARPLDLDTAQWLFDQLDQTAEKAGTRSRFYTRPVPVPSASTRPNPADAANHFGVLRVSHAGDLPDFQELATGLRNTSLIRWSYQYVPARAILVRGDEKQMEMLQWLFEQLDQPAAAANTNIEYRLRPEVNDVINLSYLAPNTPTDAFQADAERVRKLFRAGSVTTYSRLRAVLMRGTEGDILQARQALDPLQK